MIFLTLLLLIQLDNKKKEKKKSFMTYTHLPKKKKPN